MERKLGVREEGETPKEAPAGREASGTNESCGRQEVRPVWVTFSSV